MTDWHEGYIGPWKKVHIASDHEIWCDGTTHAHRDGGHRVPYDTKGPGVKRPWNPDDYPCNCALYAPGGKLHVPINGHGPKKRGRR